MQNLNLQISPNTHFRERLTQDYMDKGIDSARDCQAPNHWVNKNGSKFVSIFLKRHLSKTPYQNFSTNTILIQYKLKQAYHLHGLEFVVDPFISTKFANVKSSNSLNLNYLCFNQFTMT